jgi:membrane protein YqaA with SNARE-associated domain
MSAAGELAGAGLLLGLVGAGTASGLVPVINAEALLTAATARSPHLWLGLTVSLTVGQCFAKVLIYLTAREGPQRLRADGRVGRLVEGLRARARARGASDRAGGRAGACPRRGRSGASPRGPAWLRPDHWARLLGRSVPGASVVLLSASVGLPPLAAVSVVAGTARLRLPLFVGACLAGRLARFALIAWPVAELVT